ncbi:MAG: c-type cytochrome [Anaerolineae bacterium]|nr:c-type cytochrome [Anaerolineae bacterium]
MSIITLILLLVTACGSSPATPMPNTSGYASLPATGDAAAGQAIYERGVKSAQACAPCHDLEHTGPPLQGIAARAAARVQGQSADAYLYQAIVAPNSYIAPGYNPDVMPGNYGTALSPQQIRDVMAYLMTLR